MACLSGYRLALLRPSFQSPHPRLFCGHFRSRPEWDVHSYAPEATANRPRSGRSVGKSYKDKSSGPADRGPFPTVPPQIYQISRNQMTLELKEAGDHPTPLFSQMKAPKAGLVQIPLLTPVQGVPLTARCSPAPWPTRGRPAVGSTPSSPVFQVPAHHVVAQQGPGPAAAQWGLTTL